MMKFLITVPQSINFPCAMFGYQETRGKENEGKPRFIYSPMIKDKSSLRFLESTNSNSLSYSDAMIGYQETRGKGKERRNLKLK